MEEKKKTTTATTTATRSKDMVGRVREAMRARGLHAYVVGPAQDEHASEHDTEHNKRRTALSAFTGSAGTIVITRSNEDDEGGQALLWTDARYWAQADRELSPRAHWTLMRDRDRDRDSATPTVAAWLRT
jgi:Xaa-Pro aminopeptidase